MIEVQCGMCGVVWNVLMWDGQFIFECDVAACRGARWNVGVMWNGVPRCGGVI